MEVILSGTCLTVRAGFGVREAVCAAGTVWTSRTTPHFGDFDSGECGHRRWFLGTLISTHITDYTRLRRRLETLGTDGRGSHVKVRMLLGLNVSSPSSTVARMVLVVLQSPLCVRGVCILPLLAAPRRWAPATVSM